MIQGFGRENRGVGHPVKPEADKKSRHTSCTAASFVAQHLKPIVDYSCLT